MPKDIHTLRVSSYDEAVQSVPELVDLFKDYGIAVIKGYDFSVEEHKNLTRLLGDNLNWNISSSAEDISVDLAYIRGGHSDNPEKEYNNSSTDYVLDWHIEQVFYKCPPLAGLWSMKKITCQPGSGNTLFVDSNEIYESLPSEDKSFLLSAVITWDKPANNHVGPFYTKAIDAHPITNIPILRVETDHGCYLMPRLHRLNNESPSEAEIMRFEKIMSSVKRRLQDDHGIRYIQQWKSGDMLIVDLFRMYHAVLGGFTYNERIMDLIVARSADQCSDVYNDPELLVG